MSTFKTLLLLSTLASGCIYQNGYGDGRLVRIDTDSAFSDQEKGLISEACHMWDRFGVQYRPSDEVDSGTPISASILVERSSYTPPDDTLGVTYQVSNRITIYADAVWGTSGKFEAPGEGPIHQADFQNVVAHELGHSMGLNHTSAENDLMFASVNNGRQMLDGKGGTVEEFKALYPTMKDAGK